MNKEKSNRKGIKKATRLLLWTLLAMLLLPVLLSLSLLLPPVQNYAVQWTSGWLSDFLQTEVSIGEVYIKPFSLVEINDLLILDQQDDTLAYVQSLEVNVRQIDRDFEFLHLNSVTLKEPYFNLYEVPEDSVLNLTFLIDAFQTDSTSDSSSFALTCSSLQLEGGRFQYRNQSQERGAEVVDFEHLNIDKLDALISSIQLDGADVTANIENLSLRDHSGFELKRLKALATVTSDSIVADQLFLELNQSHIEGNVAMHYDGWSAMSNFMTDVDWDATLDQAAVSMNDIAFFAPILKNTLSDAVFQGHIKGSINNLKADVESLTFLETSYLKGKLRIKGLPDPEALFIQANVRDLYVALNEVQGLGIPGAEQLTELKLPSQLVDIGTLSFKGNYTGFLNDFVAFGDISSPLGRLSMDVNLKAGDDDITYSGKVATTGLDLSSLVSDNAVGKVAFDLRVKGDGFDFKEMRVNAIGNVQSAEILAYEYRDIVLDGTLDKQVFTGSLAVEDENLSLDFKGLVDMTSALPQIQCESNVKRINFNNLNLISGDSMLLMSAAINLDMTGKSRDQLHGSLDVTDFACSYGSRNITIDSLTLDDELLENGHDIKIRSDFFNIAVNGQTDLFVISQAFAQLAHAYVPHYFPEPPSHVDTTQRFDYAVTVFHRKKFTHFIDPSLELVNDLKLNGTVDTRTDLFTLNSDSISVRYKEAEYRRMYVRAAPSSDTLIMTLTGEQFELSSEYFISNVRADFYVHNDSLQMLTQWKNETERADEGKIGASISLHKTDTLIAHLNTFDITSGGVRWYSPLRAMVRLDSTMVEVHDFRIQSDDGLIACEGIMSRQPSDTLKLTLHGIDLSYLSKLGLSSMEVEGEMDAEVELKRATDAMLVDAAIDVQNLIFNGVEFGNIRGNSDYSELRKSLGVDVLLEYQEQENIALLGEYYPFRETEQLDMKLELDDFRVTLLQPFLDRYVSDLDGTIKGAVAITGSLKAPTLKGDLNLNEFQSRVGYLNTLYTIPDGNVIVRPDFIGCDAIPVLDERGEKAYATATVFHNNFANFNYDIYLSVENFLCLNTDVSQNDQYYGRAAITGDVDISGNGIETNIEVIAATNKGTRISIPLDKPGEAGDYDYIHFVGVSNEERLENLKEKAREQVKGLSLNFQLAVNDKAVVKIIFDEKIGDVIEVRGAADMLMEIDTRGKFNMYGDYTINNGEYLFTLQNIISKRFAVKQGSKISWSGSPYDAQLDLAAIYSRRASPYNLVASTGDTSDYYKQRMPVDVYLNMRGSLEDPLITFDVDLPGLPEGDLANQLLDPANITPQELNKQVFSLLLANSFAPQQGFSTGGIQNTTGLELLSNQFSNWATQYFDKLDVGFNYQQGDHENTSDLAELSLAREFFEDRLLVELNGSVQGDNPSNEEASNVAGEFNVEYKISETDNGSIRARVFQEANNYNAVNLNQSPYTQGVGIFYRKEFNGNGALRKLFTRKEKETETLKPAEEIEPSSEPEANPENESPQLNTEPEPGKEK